MDNVSETQILEYIKLNGKIQELISRSNDDNVYVQYGNESITLTNFIKKLLDLITSRPTLSDTEKLIANRIQELIGGAPETLDTLKEIADALTENKNLVDILNAAIETKVDKVEGKSLSTNDFTDYEKAKLNSAVTVTEFELKETSPYPLATKVITQYIRELQRLATPEQNGLMPKQDKQRLDNLRGIWYGFEPPDEMIDGDLFILERSV